jgi:hypothetical protein
MRRKTGANLPGRWSALALLASVLVVISLVLGAATFDAGAAATTGAEPDTFVNTPTHTATRTTVTTRTATATAKVCVGTVKGYKYDDTGKPLQGWTIKLLDDHGCERLLRVSEHSGRPRQCASNLVLGGRGNANRLDQCLLARETY